MGSFTIDPVPGHPIVHVTMEGIFTLSDVDRLAVSQAKLAELLRYRAGMFDILIDVTACPIQPVDVADALNILSEYPDFQPARLAFVHGDAAVKMQIRRQNACKGADFFTDRDSALAWLIEQRTGTGS